MSKHFRHVLYLLCVSSLLLGCSTTKLMEKEEKAIEKETAQTPPPVPREIPAPKPVAEQPNPLAGKTITLSANNASFTDIFSAIAETAGLDLVIDSRLVSQGRESARTDQAQAAAGGTAGTAGSPGTASPIALRTVNIAFNKTPLEEALNNLTESLNVFSEIRGRCLYVKGTASRTYHLNFISSQKETRLSVGGDVLGGNNGTGGGSSGGSSGSSGGSSSSPLAGEFSIQGTNPTSSNDIYVQIEQIVKASMTAHGSYSLNRTIGFLEVNDRKNSIDRIDSYIRTIKKYYNSQVLITAKILEVSLNDSSKYGIDWTSIHGRIGDYLFNPIQQTLQLPTANLTPAFQIEVHNTESGFDAAMNALQEFGDIKVLSNPRIRVTNGQPALISVGTNNSYIEEIKLTTTTSEGGQTITTPEITVGSIFDGIMLGVLPYIDLETNEVNISITPIKSRIVSLEERTISGNVYTLPTVDLKEATTQLRVRSGNIVALGGLMSKDLSDQTKNIPILGTIPFLGYLFSQKEISVETEELVILLEPVILEN